MFNIYHVSLHETRILLRDMKVDGHINIDYDVRDLEGEFGNASNADIIAYVSENHNMNVFPAHIAYDRRKTGIRDWTSRKLGTGKAKPRTCPPKKEEATHAGNISC